MGNNKKVMCNVCYREMRSDVLKRHMKQHADLSSTGSGAVLSEQSIPQHVPQEILNKNAVPSETYNYVSRQYQGWSSAYKNIEVRNKQLEA